jgi:hypothetical protein
MGFDHLALVPGGVAGRFVVVVARQLPVEPLHGSFLLFEPHRTHTLLCNRVIAVISAVSYRGKSS